MAVEVAFVGFLGCSSAGFHGDDLDEPHHQHRPRRDQHEDEPCDLVVRLPYGISNHLCEEETDFEIDLVVAVAMICSDNRHGRHHGGNCGRNGSFGDDPTT
jgi:hypothetical protein